ncbi:hypothetical protein RHGRI_001001 [Rhododendron griersonianum]|uniref:L-dopachrome isomerase n=1 Tax=Rhododendron griersonianum TaxID=479676 RepID=A0AAV6LJU6_9ERIC|nr:hypothetical protein RHGRI_001001 [Rhododendron griersonianum]
MPTLNLFTNVPVDAVVTSDILKDATKAVAKIIGKPESYVMIVLNASVPIAFAGTEEPAAYGELISIGGLGPSVNGQLSSTLADILQTKLSIDSSRFYIKFYDVQTFTNVLTMDAVQRKGGYDGKVEGLFSFCWSSSLADRKSHNGTSDGGIDKKV